MAGTGLGEKQVKTLLAITTTHALRGGVESIFADLHFNLPRRGWRVVAGLTRGKAFNDPVRFASVHGIADWVKIDGSGGTPEARVGAIVKAFHEVRPNILFTARVADGYEAAYRLKKSDPHLRFATTIQAYENDYFADLLKWKSIVDLCVTSGQLIRGACVEVCGLDEERCVSIPGGVRAGDPPRRDHQGTLRVGYAGRLEDRQKRIWDLVRIAETLCAKGLKFHLRIAGSGPEQEALKAKLKGLLGTDFVFDGWIDDPDRLREFFRQIDVFVHAAGNEGVTIAPREAMAEGVVPVISEFVGFWTEGHFRPGENCLSFPTGDVEAAARAIARLESDRALLGRLSAAAAHSQSDIYSSEGAIDAWATSFDRCLIMPSQPAPRQSPSKNPCPGRLSRFGVPPAIAQALRDMLGRTPNHLNGGNEWPHAGPPADGLFAQALREYSSASESSKKEAF